MKQSGVKRAITPLILTILLLLIGSTVGDAEQSVMDQISYEVKFLLSPDKVLNENRQLTEAIADQFSLEPSYTPIDVIYLETADRTFLSEGWVNRIRWKDGKKKPEVTCKKRSTVAGEDPAAILAALDRVASGGIDLQSDSCSLEVDWGYSKMTLSVTWEASGKFKDYQSLKQFNTGDAIAYFAEFMPVEEKDWNNPGWGTENLARAQKVGITVLNRVKGIWEDTEVTFDIITISSDGAAEELVELSFKANSYSEAAEKRRQLTAILEESGILLEADALKTQKILDAGLYEAPPEPDAIVPESATVVEEQAFQSCGFQYVWCGNNISAIRSGAFADCPNLRYLRLPAAETEIDESALPAGGDLCIIGVPGSFADTYANVHSLAFNPQ
ncbi:MAG: leucine-rich repeat protein [Clostridia bacterium]|nr:leucine-rich repeat protein [Clostridia bacterium]